MARTDIRTENIRANVGDRKGLLGTALMEASKYMFMIIGRLAC